MRLLLLLALALAAPAFAPPLDYFCDSYPQCRERFLAAATAARSRPPIHSQSRLLRLPVGDLSIDALYLPAQRENANLVLLFSGVHGVEGFAGSALQQLFLHDILPRVDRERTAYLIVHGVNPHGFLHRRRVTANNVDLNRNLLIDPRLFGTAADGYTRLNDFLNPTGPVSTGMFSQAGFLWRTLRLLLREPLRTLRQAVLGGQYLYPRGIYFGGTAYEPQRALLEPLLLDIGNPFQRVLVLDLHTGYGRRGVLHLIPAGGSAEAATRVFRGTPIENPQGEEFYETSGDFATYVANLFATRGKLAVSMVMEYGTSDNTTTLGGIESLRLMVDENQLHWYGPARPPMRDKICARFVEHFYPSAPEWRNTVIETTRTQLPTFLERFSALAP